MSKTPKRRPYKKDAPVSLAPLSLPEALRALMKVKPKDAKGEPQGSEEPEGEGEPAPDRGK